MSREAYSYTPYDILVLIALVVLGLLPQANQQGLRIPRAPQALGGNIGEAWRRSGDTEEVPGKAAPPGSREGNDIILCGRGTALFLRVFLYKYAYWVLHSLVNF